MAGYLEIARGEVGYHAPSENVTKYWAALQPSFQGAAWCGAFTSWCLMKAGVLTVATGGPMYYVPAMVDRARSRGQWSSRPRVGALAIFDFGSGMPKHVGFCIGSSAASVTSIDGNTGSDEVAIRTRGYGQVLGFWHIPVNAGAGIPGPVDPRSGDWGPVDYGGMSDMTTVTAAAQTIAGAPEGEAAIRFGSRGRIFTA